mgnify:CR=1 FL=1
MNILITGDRGFFGRHLKRRYTNHEIFVSNTSVRNLNNIENLYDLNTKKLDLIFHLAAKTKAGDWCLSHSGDQWIDNHYHPKVLERVSTTSYNGMYGY